MSIKKNITKNVIANGLQKLIRVIDQLLLIPFFVSSWGIERYGEWVTLTIIPSILMFSDFGIGTATSNSFILKYAKNEFKEAAIILKTGIRFVTYAILSVLFVLTILTSVGYQLNFFKFSVFSERDAMLTFIIMITAKLPYFYLQIFESLYRAKRKAALGKNILNLYSIITIGVTIIILISKGSIVTLSVANLILTIIFVPIVGLLAFKMLNLKEYKKARIDLKKFQVLAKLGLGYMLAPTWQAILFQCSTLVVRITIGPSAVAIYNTARTLSRSVNQILMTINGGFFPELQYELATGNYDTAKKIFKVSFLATIFFSIIGSAFLLIFGTYFYNIWTKNTMQMPTLLWFFLIISVFFNALWWSTETVFMAKNLPYKINNWGVLFAVLSVVVTFILCKLFGVIGAGFGLLLFEILMAITILPKGLSLINLRLEDLISISEVKYLFKSIKLKLNKTIS